METQMLICLPCFRGFFCNWFHSPLTLSFWGFFRLLEGRKEARTRMFVCSVLADVPLVVLQELIKWPGTGAWSTAEPGKGRDPAPPADVTVPLRLARPGGCVLPAAFALPWPGPSPADGTVLGGILPRRTSPCSPGPLLPALVSPAEAAGTHGSPRLWGLGGENPRGMRAGL